MTFLGGLEYVEKIEKYLEKKIICRDFNFFLINSHCTCSKLSFEVCNYFVAKNLKF